MLTQTANRTMLFAPERSNAGTALREVATQKTVNYISTQTHHTEAPTSRVAAEVSEVTPAVTGKPAASPKSTSHSHNPLPPAATYIPPGLEVLHYPESLNSFDGFVVSGQVWGSDKHGTQVQVSIAGITRTARVRDGLWDVFFEDGAIPRHRHGNRDLIASVRDSKGNTARTAIRVTVEEFVESFVLVDAHHGVSPDGTTLQVTGELSLGSHLASRELIVLLISDDAEGTVAATGTVKPQWQFGEWQAAVPLVGVRPGRYRVRALLVDNANAALTRVDTGVQEVVVAQEVRVG